LKNFKINSRFLIFLALSTGGLADSIFGIFIYSNVVTLFILLLFFIQLVTFKISVPKWFIYLNSYIIIQTFLYNSNVIDFQSSFRHFFAFLLFSITINVFLLHQKLEFEKFMKVYHILSFFFILVAFFQILLFTTLNFTFLPQNIISGNSYESFSPEILGFIPRAPSVFSEPAHYATFLLPSVYCSITNLLNKYDLSGEITRFKSIIFIFGMVLTFSLVGYFFTLICFVYVFNLKSNRRKYIFNLQTIFLMLAIGTSIFIVAKSPLSNKISSFINQGLNPGEFEYTSSDLTGFALISNFYVAYESLIGSSYLGSGFNTHVKNYDRFIGNNFTEKQIIMELNKEDAGSIYLRLISEFGIPGLLFLILFLVKFKVRSMYFGSSYAEHLNNLSLIMIITYSFRQGSYLSVYFLLFLGMYFYSYILHRDFIIKEIVL
jgi:hypothetical protein